MRTKTCLQTLLLTLLSITAYCQSDSSFINRAVESLAKQMAASPVEKLYLQLDRPVYAVGDTLWYKAYAVTGQYHQLSALSGVLYVELIDDKDSVTQRLKLPLVNGLAWGDMALIELKEGNYRIRGYTNWMRNAGQDYFFDKNITIVNAITKAVFTKAHYTYSTLNGQQQVKAVINYASLEGVPYNGKEVAYRIEINKKMLAQGNGLTDEKGNLNIGFVNNTSGQLQSGWINTDVKLDNKVTVTKSVLIKATSAAVDVQFFPEGGSLLEGNNTIIAFKAVGVDGLGAAIKGVITDDQNNEVTTFSSAYLGMGVFNLKPKAGRTYRARVTYADGSANIVDLPKATATGYALSIDNITTDTLNVKITATAGETGAMSLVAQSGGTIYYGAKSRPGINSFIAAIPKKLFPSGIVQFILFSSKGEPVNERLVFIRNHDQLKLDIATEKQTFAPREKVKVTLGGITKDGKPATGSFSVSVTDETKVPVDETTETTIFSNLLLTSDLKGYVEDPNYYFINSSKKTAADLDALMLTQGYHRFEWKQVINNNFPIPQYQPEKALTIAGSLKTLGGKPVVNGRITLLAKTNGAFLLNTVTDDEGRFAFKNLVFNDSTKFVIQARTANGKKEVQLSLDNPAPQQVGPNKNAPDLQVNISDSFLPFLENSKTAYNNELKYGLNKQVIQLKEVEIKEKKKTRIDYSANLNGPGVADVVITAADMGALTCPKLSDCLDGRIGGVIFRNGFPLLLRSAGPSIYSTTAITLNPLLIIIDGVPQPDPVFDPTKPPPPPSVLTEINSSDVASIEVLLNPAYTAIYGVRGANGVILVTTKTGRSDASIQSVAPGIITFMPKGYYKSDIFYSPRYDHPQNQTMPDLRSTIYWNPNIITGNDGKASFEYFNADAKGTYRIIVEGIDNYGNLGRQVYEYKVE